MKITFSAGKRFLEGVASSPVLAKSLIPQWYKDIKPVDNHLNIKNCIPFLDALSAGYIQTTWADIHITKNNDSVNISVDSEIELLGERDNASLATTKDYYSKEFIWRRYWIPKLPQGFSLLVTHPLNRLDLPFTTASAVIDSDGYYHRSYGNIPFYVKKDFEGIIPKGTPMYQLIPIKREDWEHETKEFDLKEILDNDAVMDSIGEHAYKKAFWQRKVYK
jgi:hypothetical protein